MNNDEQNGPPSLPAGTATLAACCRASAGRYLRRHRDVATCDTCGMLLLAYANDQDFDETRRALIEQGTTFATDQQGRLRLIAKARAVRSARRRPG